jgi:MFS family permease
MRMTRRRFWVYLLLFVFSAIAYIDRVNMSVAGKPIAQELGLSPVALGYLFSCFLWAYVLMMLPGGRLIDRWGAHVVAGTATVVWSIAQMATGAATGVVTMFLARLGLGVGEAPFSRWSIAASGHGRPIPSAARQLPSSAPAEVSVRHWARRWWHG